MPCFHPIDGWYANSLNQNGKRSVTFKWHEAFLDMPVQVACGRCIGCRLERSRQMALRMMHESELHEENCSLTLTYNDESLPHRFIASYDVFGNPVYSGGLDRNHVPGFMKRLRWHCKRKISYYYCGEYGDENNRPHYHVLIFGLEFPDKQLCGKSHAGFDLYSSDVLSSLWRKGHCTIGQVNFESAAYAARYILKKINGDEAKAITWDGCPGPYTSIDVESGEIILREPEFAFGSTKPGIGRRWLEKFKSDVFPSDSVIHRGLEVRPPKYYGQILEKIDSALFADIKLRRRIEAVSRKEDSTAERLSVRERVKRAQLSMLKRSL